MDLHRRQRRTIRSKCLLVLVLLCCVLPVKSISSRRHLLCIYPGFSSRQYQIEETPMDLCTHVLYSGSSSFPWKEHDFVSEKYQKFADIKNRQPNVKLIMKIICFRDTCQDVVASNDTRKVFIENAIRFLRQYNLDGLSYEWSYPAQESKQDYATLIEETKQAFKSAGHDTWTVSVDVPGEEKYIDKAFDQQRICGAADFVILWVDRLHWYHENTDIPIPLYRRRFETGPRQRFNVMDATQNWINGGCPRDKILLRVVFRGKKFALYDVSDHRINTITDHTKYPQRMEYNEICSLLQEAGWTIDWDEESRAPFAYRGTEWIGYENEVSLEEKVNFVDGEGLGGLVVESLDEDDFKGVCGKKYPLLTAVWKAYKPTRSTDGDPFAFAIFRTTKRPR